MTAVITPAIEAALITAAGHARCKRDQRGAVLVRPVPGGIVAWGANGLPAGLSCSPQRCQPTCAKVAEHAEAAVIRNCVLGAGQVPAGVDMVHAKVVDGAIAVSHLPTEKTCKTCAVLMYSWGVSGIWLFVEGGFAEPLGQWTRWSVEEYYRLATGTTT